MTDPYDEIEAEALDSMLPKADNGDVTGTPLGDGADPVANSELLANMDDSA